jgi:hypothetical protein
MEHKMKNWRLLLLAGLMIPAQQAFSQVPSGVEVSPDLGLSLQYDMPGVGDYDLYEYGIVTELQFRDWVRHPWGYSLAIGYGEWTTDKNASSPGSGLYDFSGNLQAFPFGGSVMYRAYEGESWSFIVDAGVRYMAYDSKIRARQTGMDASKKYDVEIDDSILYALSANADYAVSSGVAWTFGLGYRNDITRGDLSTELVKGRDSIMESIFASAALRMSL